MRTKMPMDAAATTPIENKSLSRISQMIPREATEGDTKRHGATSAHEAVALWVC